MNIKQILYIIIGFIGLAIGFIGAIIPLLPSFPFLLLAAICFAKSSKKLDTWFKNTKLYKDNLESYINGKGMTKKAKTRVLITLSLVFAFGFIMMSNVPTARIILLIVWLGHILYFIYKVKTIS